MPLVKILRKYDNAEGWVPGDIVDITDPVQLIREGKVARVDEEGNVISEEKTQAQKIIDSLGKGEAIDLAINILKRFPLDELPPLPGTPPVVAPKTPKVEEPKVEAPKVEKPVEEPKPKKTTKSKKK